MGTPQCESRRDGPPVGRPGRAVGQASWLCATCVQHRSGWRVRSCHLPAQPTDPCVPGTKADATVASKGSSCIAFALEPSDPSGPCKTGVQHVAHVIASNGTSQKSCSPRHGPLPVGAVGAQGCPRVPGRVPSGGENEEIAAWMTGFPRGGWPGRVTSAVPSVTEWALAPGDSASGRPVHNCKAGRHCARAKAAKGARAEECGRDTGRGC